MSVWARRGGLVLGLGAVFLAVLVVWAGGRGLLSGREDETWARCQREGVLRVGLDATYPPFEVEEGGVLRGYDVDLAREIGRRIGLEVVFVNMGFDGLYDALEARRCDVLISALPYERHRSPVAAYTGGYFNAGQVLVGREDDPGIQSKGDLAHRVVVVEMGSHAHQEALRIRDRERVPLTIVTARCSEDTFEQLLAGKADAAIVEHITARLAVRTHQGLAIRGESLTDESFVIAVRQGSPKLFAAVNGALNALRGEGWLEWLADRWL